MNVPKLLIKVFQVFNDQTNFLFGYEPFIGEHQSPVKSFHDICIRIKYGGADIGRISHHFPVHTTRFYHPGIPK